jgi:hypothetical protein
MKGQFTDQLGGFVASMQQPDPAAGVGAGVVSAGQHRNLTL